MPKPILEEVRRWLSATVIKVLDHLTEKKKNPNKQNQKYLELLSPFYENIFRISRTGQRLAC